MATATGTTGSDRSRKRGSAGYNSSTTYSSPSTYRDNPFYRRTPDNDAKSDPALLSSMLQPPTTTSLLSNDQILPGRPRRRVQIDSTGRRADNVSKRKSSKRSATFWSRSLRSIPILRHMIASSSSQTSEANKISRRKVKSTNIYDDIEDGQDSSRGRNSKTRKSRYQRSSSHRPTLPPLVIFHRIKLPIAILIWYILGVLSISTTKILLRDWSVYCSPTTITIQQFVVGVSFLRCWMYMTRSQNQATNPPIIPIAKCVFHWLTTCGKRNTPIHNTGSGPTRDTISKGNINLFASSTFFTLGFFFTNLSFFGSDASYVETIKASEPMTSATVSALWGLERLSHMEIWSLLGICSGVVISTLGSATGVSPTTTPMSTSNSLGQSLWSSGIVLVSNICFSFRGLYQKLFRASPRGDRSQVNDIALQFQMQFTGIILMMGPFIIWDVPRLFYTSFRVDTNTADTNADLDMRTYFMLAIVNGFAFTHYNLASTYVLSQLSVVHHAALNCIRRLFAIVVTSFVFDVPITVLSGSGVAVSLIGFLAYTHYKAEKVNKPRPLSSLLPLSE